MANLERRMIIPGKEKALMEAHPGDTIKISYLGDKDNIVSMWTALFKESDKIYTFIAQEKSKAFAEESQVRQYTSDLSRIQFDNQKGAILNNFGYNLHFISKKSEETYGKMVNVLKEAKLWDEDIFYALYDEKGENLIGAITDEKLKEIEKARGEASNYAARAITLEEAKKIRNILLKK